VWVITYQTDGNSCWSSDGLVDVSFHDFTPCVAACASPTHARGETVHEAIFGYETHRHFRHRAPAIGPVAAQT